MKKTGNNRKLYMKLPALALVISLVFGSFPAMAENTNILTLEKVITLSLASNSDYKDLKSKIATKTGEYNSAVKAVKLNNTDNSTYRWTPIMSLTLPDGEKLSEQYEYTYKPYQLQTELLSLTHKLITLKNSSQIDISQKYAKAYALMQKVDIATGRDEYLETEVKRNTALYKKGSVPKSRITDTENLKAEVEDELAQDQTDLLAAEEEIGEAIGFDLTTQTILEDPMLQITLSRDYLEDWIQDALDNDQDLYEQRMDTEAKRLAVETNYDLMHDKYGSKISPMATYISSLENGHSINEAAMEDKYNEIIEEIENESDGTTKIIGMKLDKSWLQGDTSGIRYIEDDPQVLLTAINEYSDSMSATETAEDKVTQSVKDQYNTLASLRRTYNSALSDYDEASETLEKKQLLAKQGLCTDEELDQAYSDAYETNLTMIDARLEYTNSLFDMDKLTCGGVTDTIEELENKKSNTLAEISDVLYDTTEGSDYFIISMAEKNSFVLGVNIADDLQGYITDFELWVDNKQVGERTDVDSTLVHMSLTTQGSDNVVLRFYSDDVFVDDCQIDPMETHGGLDIKTNYRIDDSGDETIGSFSYTVNRSNKTVELTLKPDISQNLHYYSVADKNGIDLLSGRKLAVKEKFTYLSAMTGDIDDLTITFYDVTKKEVCKAKLVNASSSIVKVEEPDTVSETDTDTTTTDDTEVQQFSNTSSDNIASEKNNTESGNSKSDGTETGDTTSDQTDLDDTEEDDEDTEDDTDDYDEF